MTDRFFRDTGLYAVSMVFPAFVGLTLISVFSHQFSTSAYGRYSLAMVFVSFLSALSTGWLDQAILRFGPEVETNALLQNSLSLLSGIGFLLLTGGVAIYFSGVVPRVYEGFILPSVVLSASISSFRVYQSILQSQLQSASLTSFKLIRSLTQFVATIGIAVFLLENITGWLWGMAVATAVVTAIMAKKTGITRPTWSPDSELLRRMFYFGAPLIGWAMTHELLSYGDRVVLEFLRGSGAVGVYSANYTIADQSFLLVSSPIIMAIHPLVMNAWDGDNVEKISGMMRSYTRYFLIIGVPAVVYISALSEPVASIMLSDSYAGGYVIIPVVAIGSFVWGVSNIGHKGLEAQERTTTMLAGSVLTVVFNLVLNVPLIRLYGFFGAALATLLSFSFYPVFVYWVTRTDIPWRIARRTVRNVALAGLPIVAAYWLLWENTSYSLGTTLLAAIPTGLLYLGVLYLLGEPTEEELSAVSELWQRTTG